MVIVRLGHYRHAVRHQPADILQAGERIQRVGKYLAHTWISLTDNLGDMLHVWGDKQVQNLHAVASRQGGPQVQSVCHPSHIRGQKGKTIVVI